MARLQEVEKLLDNNLQLITDYTIEARKEAEKKYFKEWRYMIGGAENDT